MLYIAKRGLFEGPDSSKENTVEQINFALSKGLNVEVDVWNIHDRWFLGHDLPNIEINKDFLQDERIWKHCKNQEAFDNLGLGRKFIHNDEDFVIINDAYATYKWQHGRLGKFVYIKDGLYWKKIAYYRDNFKLRHVFIDVDGVMCRGKSYDIDHNITFKNFCDLDFTAIKRLKAAGIGVYIVSGDEWNSGMARARNIPFIKTETLGINSKLNTLKRWNFNLEESACIADDYYDLPLINSCGFAFCPADAIKEVKNECHTLTRRSGDGVLAEMYECLAKDRLVNRVAPNEG